MADTNDSKGKPKKNQQKTDKHLLELMELIRFTENISAKIHGLRQESDIFTAIIEGFRKSKLYTALIFRLVDDGAAVEMIGTSMVPEMLKGIEKISGMEASQFRIELKKSTVFSKVARDGETVQTEGKDIVLDIITGTSTSKFVKMINGMASELSVLTPLYQHEKIIGVFSMTFPMMAEEFIPSVRNLAQHISTALETAGEYAERREAEELLRASEKEYRNLVEQISDIIFSSKKDGTIDYMSPAVEKIAGYKPSELIGNNFTSIVFPDDLPDVANAFQQSLGKDYVTSLECRVVVKSGEPRWMRASAQPVFDTEGNVTGFRGVITDIDERKLAEEASQHSEKYFRLLLENAPDLIVVLNADATIRYVSPAMERIAGYGPEELIGKEAFDYVHQDEKQRAIGLFSEGINTPDYTISIETCLQRKDGSWSWVDLIGKNLLDDPVVRGIVLNFRDINERKEAEERIKHLNDALRAIRNVNQLIVRERDRDRMIQLACETLVETRGYTSAWIALVNETGSFILAAEAGIGDEFSALTRQMGDGNWPFCVRKVLEQENQMVMLDISVDCADCPARENCGKQKPMVVRLEHGVRVYGMLCVSVPEFAALEEEQELFREVAEDIGFALHDIELEQERHEAEEELKVHSYEIESANDELRQTQEQILGINRKLGESEEKYRTLIENAGTPITYLDTKGKVLLINSIGAANLGGKTEDFIGKSLYEVMPDIADMTMERMQEVLESGHEKKYEDYMGLQTGGRWFASNLYPVQDEGGRMFGIQIISQDITERKLTEERMRHLNSVLHAVRDVNELIIREENNQQMIQSICDALLNTGAYRSAWVLLFDYFEQFTIAAEAGIGDDFSLLVEQMKQGAWPDCAKRLMEQSDGTSADEMFCDCSGCPLFHKCGDGDNLTVQMVHSERPYGLICALSSADQPPSDEERALFGEVAGNIAFALHDLELEEERKRAEEVLKESEDRFREIFENANDEIIYMDNAGTIIDTNARVETIFGYTRKEVIGKNFSELGFFIPDYMPSMVDQFSEAVNGAGGQGLIELEVVHKSGNVIYVEASISPIKKKNSVEGLLVIVRDITSRKQMEERINQYSAELEQRLEELQTAYEKLQELDKMKDSFLSTVSHELRTPLTSIKSFAEILLTYDSDPETQKEFLNIINDESDRLTRLINDFLDLSKIESGRIEWQTTIVEMPLVIEQAVNAADALAKKMNLTVDVDLEPDLPAVWGDRDRFVQVVTNLISNATKFTPEGGNIWIKAETVEGDGSGEAHGMVEFSVTDNGRGIATEDQEAIFQKFTQIGDTLRDKPPGTGLGLAICREILEHYDGKIWVESELDKGSTFFFILPIASVAGAEETGVEVEWPEKEVELMVEPRIGNTILVVDDEINIRRFLSHELSRKGYNVIEAGGGKETIEMARKYLPDLITLDVMLPDISGFDVTVTLKDDPTTRNIPILIISVLEEKEKAFRVGANDYVTKPFNGEILLQKIAALLSNPQGTILVVDDDKSLVRSITFELNQRGYTTSVAHDGEEALEVVSNSPPDLIILDIMMPKMDGHMVIKELRSKAETSGIPIIVLTGLEVDGDRIKALSLGATDYFTKSGGLGKLFETAAKILKIETKR